MKSLYIGNSVQILPSYLQPEGTFSDSDSEHEHDGNVYEKQGFILRAPQLRKLCIRDLFVTRGPTYFDLLLKPLPELTHLDLSGAFHKEGMENFCWLLCLPELVSLILHNVQGDHPHTFLASTGSPRSHSVCPSVRDKVEFSSLSSLCRSGKYFVFF